MQNISANDLDLVTGGTPSATTGNTGSTGSTGSGGGNNDALLTGLQSIQSSIKDLGKNQNQGGLFGGQNGLLFMTMALAMRQRSEVTVCSGGRCGGGYYSYRTGW